MPHACVKCKTVHPDQSQAILKGCSCGSRIFYFIKSDLPVVQLTLTGEQGDLVTQEFVELSREKPIVVIDTDGPENIKVVEPGSYELNVASLFKGDLVIVRTDAEVYYVKLPQPKKAKK